MSNDKKTFYSEWETILIHSPWYSMEQTASNVNKIWGILVDVMVPHGVTMEYDIKGGIRKPDIEIRFYCEFANLADKPDVLYTIHGKTIKTAFDVAVEMLNRRITA